MAGFLSKITSKIRRSDDDLFEEADKEYVELNTQAPSGEEAGITVRPFVLTDFNDVKEIVDTFREGNTIAMINIAPLKEKDMIELKRAINKIKKTCDAIEGDLAGIGENYLVATPKFVKIYRGPTRSVPKKESSDEEDLE
ncbi:MAG: cell division protein SepF [Candidatus Woesearchaeota archaeon]